MIWIAVAIIGAFALGYWSGELNTMRFWDRCDEIKQKSIANRIDHLNQIIADRNDDIRDLLDRLSSHDGIPAPLADDTVETYEPVHNDPEDVYERELEQERERMGR